MRDTEEDINSPPDSKEDGKGYTSNMYDPGLGVTMVIISVT
jgi:hypothetical protein